MFIQVCAYSVGQIPLCVPDYVSPLLAVDSPDYGEGKDDQLETAPS